MTKRLTVTAFRLAFGLLALSAVGRQFAVQVQMGFSVVNFFSYFTNLSNLLAGVVLIFGAFQSATHRAPSAWNDFMRGAAAVNMAVVGVVFAVLLRDVDLGHLLPWVNAALHYVLPVAVVFEWLSQPPGARLSVRQALLWQAFPLLYLAYVLGRGAVVGWYPYPFLNPAGAGGAGGVAAHVCGIVAVFLLAGWALRALGNRRREAVALLG